MNATKNGKLDTTRGLRHGRSLTGRIATKQQAAVDDGRERRVLLYLLNRECGVTYRALAREFEIDNARVISEMQKAITEIEGSSPDAGQRRTLRELRKRLTPAR